jgi:hypothetical protein
MKLFFPYSAFPIPRINLKVLAVDNTDFPIWQANRLVWVFLAPVAVRKPAEIWIFDMDFRYVVR